MDDLEALQGCLKGDREAFARHFTPLISGIVRDPDLSQEVFAALFEHDCRKLRQFDPAKGSPASWIGRIARQTASKRRERPGAPFPGEPSVPAAQADDLEPVRAALRTLPPQEALCLALLVQQGLSAREVASILGIHRQNVYPIRDRALEKLRRILGENGI